MDTTGLPTRLLQGAFDLLRLFVTTIVASCRRMSRCDGSLGHVTWIAIKLSSIAFLVALGIPVLGVGWLSNLAWAIFTVIGGPTAPLFLLCSYFALDDAVRAVHSAVRGGKSSDKPSVSA